MSSGVPNETLLPLILSREDDHDKEFFIASLWLKDAMEYRTVNRKALESPSRLFFNIKRSTALRLLYSLPARISLLLAIWLHLLLPILPLQLYPFPLIGILLVYLIREALIQYVRPFRLRTIFRLVAIFAMLTVVVLAEYSIVSRQSSSMISGIFGPIFLIDAFPSLRLMSIAMILSSISVLPIILSITCMIALFACMGHLLFSGSFYGIQANPKFHDLTTSALSMVYLMTTVNFPDIMMPNYHQYRATFIFFGLYLVLGLLMFAWLLASVYSAYVDIRLKQVTTLVANQKASLALVFDRIASGSDSLGQEDFYRLMSYYKSAVERNYILALFKLLDRDNLGYISKQSWLDHAGSCLDISVRRLKRHEIAPISTGAMQTLANSTPVLLIRMFTIILMVWLLLERIINPLTDEVLERMGMFILVLQLVFLLEAVARFVVFRQNILYDKIQQIDIGLIIASSIGIIHFPRHEYFQILAIGRLVNFVPLIQLAHSLKRIGLLLTGMLALTLSVFYLFSYVGQLLFMDAIIDGPTQRIKLLATDTDVARTWIESNYFDLNFNTFLNALVTLFVLAIVNNWHIITNGYMILTNSVQSCIFFVTFYFVTVVLALNIGAGLIIEEFMLTYRPRSPWQNRLLHILTEQYPHIPVNEWVITKAIHLQLMLMDHIDSDLLKIAHFRTWFQTAHLLSSQS